MVEPEFFKLLLLNVSGREVGKEAGLALKLVGCCILHLDFTIGVECLEWRPISGSFCLTESAMHV